MKPDVRVVGFDDAPFKFTDGKVAVIGVVMRGATYVEAVLSAEVEVDGVDATDVLAAVLTSTRHAQGLRAVLVDGASFGGFNVLDIHALRARVGLPVATVTRGAPDADAVRAALANRFPDGERRWAVLERQWPEPFPTGGTVLHVARAGLSREEVAELLARTTVRGLVPEPLRVAHLVATALVKGESRGQ